MNRTEHLLTILAEEGAEVAQAATKCLRFGLDDRKTLDPTGPPGDGPTNRERLLAEITDLIAVASMLAAEGVFPAMGWIDWTAAERKKYKVEAYLKYSARQGTLHPPITGCPDCQGTGEQASLDVDSPTIQCPACLGKGYHA